MLTSFVLSIILAANIIYFIMHKSSGNKTHPMKKKINSSMVEKRTKHQQRNKEPAPAEEQRTSTSRRTKNQHRQRIKEAAEEQRTSDERRDESKKNQFVF
ncbi:hypothetical protein Gotur_022456, partial [Gossypium turneri]